MKNHFKEYLINQGYKLVTPSGNPSTVIDYIKRIDKVCEWENISIEALAKDISKYVYIYDKGGVKEELGNMSHKAVINALRRFQDFLKQY